MMTSEGPSPRRSPEDEAREERLLRAALIATALEGVGQDTGRAIAELRRRGNINQRMIKALVIAAAIQVLTIIAIIVIATVRLNS